jgi:hypothetical protein
MTYQKLKIKNQKSKIKNIFTFYIVILIFTFCILILGLGAVSAVNMDSSRYRIQFGNINIAGGNKTSDNYSLSDTVGQTAAGKFQSDGYIVKAGFQYIHSIIPFSFSISDISINFGSVIASIPTTQTTDLTVSFGAAGEYQVTAIEEGKLRTLNEANNISDTSCDGGGENTCNEDWAKPWTQNSAYGFGYRMDGDDIPQAFATESSHFRPFPDRTTDELPRVVMSSGNVGKNRQSTVTFKLNVSPIQTAGTYQTVINFVATPSF